MNKIYLSFITFILSLALLELGFYSISFFIPSDFVYKPPTLHQFKEYLSKNINRNLGWDRAGKEELSPEGYRLAPASKNMSTPVISLYGESFTWADEVPPEAAWGNILTTLIGCRVDNYGVIGYGTDQAYLRFLSNKNDKSKIIILSHMTENIVRNINQDRTFIYDQGILLKPRLLTDETGNLTLLPIPLINIEDYNAYVKEPQRFLTADYLLPNTNKLSKRNLAFPYCYHIPYLFTYKRVSMSLMSEWFDGIPPWYSELYDPRHPSQAYQLTRNIMINFVKNCNSMGKKPLILFIPNVNDIKYYDKTGQWVYGSMINSLKREGIPAYNVGPLLLNKLSSNDLCRHFCTDKKAKSGHYTSEGNRILAEVVAEILTQNVNYQNIISKH